MKVIHIESGLGNQMLSYCEYLALKKVNPNDDFYIETIVFEIPECNEVICQWNGYELDKIFSLNKPKNIKSLFSHQEWQEIVSEVRATEFWKHNWNYPVAITSVLKNHGLKIENCRGDFDPNHNIVGTGYQQKKGLKDKLRSSYFGVTLKRYWMKWNESKYLNEVDKRKNVFLKTAKDIYTGQWLNLKFRQNGRDLIDEEIKRTFVFPKFIDKQNLDMVNYLNRVNAVAIHARRGDMLGDVAWCYKYGYFKRAVNHIKKNVEKPVFVFFTNPGSIEWCKENASIFGLDFTKDKILFVDWNKGKDSFRDIQLMSYCKHAIITLSSFGWWGAYFIKNPNKITISPILTIDTTYHC